MRGPERLRGFLSTYLASSVPTLVDLARTQWSLTAQQFPKPTRYNAAEPLVGNFDTYPYVGSYVVSDDDHRHVDISDQGELEFATRYTMQIFVCVSTPLATADEVEQPQFKATLRLRNDLTTIVRAALLAGQDLDQPDEVELLPDSMSTSYTDALVLDPQRNTFRAGGFIQVTFKLTESLSVPALGTADTFEVETELLEDDS